MKDAEKMMKKDQGAPDEAGTPDGLEVAVDLAEARSWFEKAAAQGIEDAQAALAEMAGANMSTSKFWLPFMLGEFQGFTIIDKDGKEINVC
jgi:TPR repeat protein